MRTVRRAREPHSAPDVAGSRILVLFEPGSAGLAAIELARDLAAGKDATVTVVGVAPQAPPLRGCGPSARDYNATVRDTVARELERAEELLWALGSRANTRLLVEGADPPFEALALSEPFDLVLLPARRRLLRGASHPVARRLSASGATEVRIVEPDAESWRWPRRAGAAARS